MVEASLVRQIVETLASCGVLEDSIGVLSLYRQQVKVISHLLQNRRGVEILTADRSQGRDKDCIIISLVRSNDHGHAGDLIKDWRRVNVSFTRARSKLIILGSRKTMRAASLLTEFIELMESKNWVMTLPADADTFHQHIFGNIKRPAAETDDPLAGEDGRSPKRVRHAGIDTILRGRHILLDLVNEDN
jgi:DNA replication ATP-dependent helicase Dna2